MSDSEGRWIHPLDQVELFFEGGHQHGTFLVCYHLILNTAQPLSEEKVQQALHHLYKKVLSLRLCIQPRNGVKWYREIIKPQLDFQEIAGGDVQSVIDGLRQYRYDVSSGPLWCCRLLYDVTTDAAEMDIPEGLEHMTHLFLGFHHGLHDATSNIQVCGWLIDILNDLIAGVPVDDDIQLGNFTSHEQTNRLVAEKKKILEVNQNLKTELVYERAAKISGLSLLRMINPVPLGSEKNGKSLHLKHMLDRPTTGRFLKKCRAEGVTAHAAFTALANVALLDILREKGILLDDCIITSSHVVNNRRYWRDPVPDSMGCHVCFPLLDLQTLTPQNASQNFWTYARSIHMDLKKQLDSGKPLLQTALNNCSPNQDYSEYYQVTKTGLSNYSTSNMGDVTPMISQERENVRLTYFYRTISVSHSSNTLSHVMHTYRGYFIYVMDYNTGTVQTKTAERFCQKIFTHLDKVLKSDKKNVPPMLPLPQHITIFTDVEEVV
ncbi:uncharacterized protein LOC119585685 [Penaeus monodon]|uniref:uncharacterized protein LOC119585685 n=1 Tax=Penaeus monodon TaxID=6687 RepID=UPI0018A74DE8|nr:uncharacterized protein LOC119585685 [Penaeus monodon]